MISDITHGFPHGPSGLKKLQKKNVFCPKNNENRAILGFESLHIETYEEVGWLIVAQNVFLIVIAISICPGVYVHLDFPYLMEEDIDFAKVMHNSLSILFVCF